MSKNKTHKGLLKRIRVTKTGLIKHKRCGGKHLKSDKPGKRTRKFRSPRFMTAGEARRLALMLHRRLRGRNQPRAAFRRSPSPEESRKIKAEKKAALAAAASGAPKAQAKSAPKGPRKAPAKKIAK